MYQPSRFFYQNRLADATIFPNSQQSGVVSGVTKAGLGSATLIAAGTYIGQTVLLYTVQIDSVVGGNEIGAATFRWRDSSSIAWIASGVTTSDASIYLTNGVNIRFVAGSGSDFVGGETFTFWGYPSFSAGNLAKLDRDTEYRSDEIVTADGLASMSQPIVVNKLYLVVFDGRLFGIAGSVSGGDDNGKLFRWNDADAWIEVAPQLENYSCGGSFAVSQGYLYVMDNGGDLLRWDNINAWEVVISGTSFYYLADFDGDLYGVSSVPGKLYRADIDGTAWVEVAPQLGSNNLLYAPTEFDGKLFVGAGVTGAGNGHLLRWNGVDAWEDMAGQYGGENYAIIALVVFDETLYGLSSIGRLLAWNGVDAWISVADPNFAGDTSFNTLMTHRGAIYAKTSTGKVIRWDGVSAWELVIDLDSSSVTSLCDYYGRLYVTKYAALRPSLLQIQFAADPISLFVDLMTARTITACVIMEHNLTAGATVTLRAGSTAACVDYSATLTVADPLVFLLSQTYQYWCLDLLDTANPDGYLRIGEWYLGDYVQLATSVAPDWGMAETTTYLAQQQTSLSGVLRQTIFGKQRRWECTWTVINNTDMAALQTVLDAVFDTESGVASPMLFDIFSDDDDIAIVTPSVENTRTYTSVGLNTYSLTLTELPSTR